MGLSPFISFATSEAALNDTKSRTYDDDDDDDDEDEDEDEDEERGGVLLSR